MQLLASFPNLLWNQHNSGLDFVLWLVEVFFLIVDEGSRQSSKTFYWRCSLTASAIRLLMVVWES